MSLTPTTLPVPMRLRIFTFIDDNLVRRPAGYRSRVRLDDGTEGIVASFQKNGDGDLSRLVLVKDDCTTLILTPQDGFSITHLLDFCVPRVEPRPRNSGSAGGVHMWSTELHFNPLKLETR